MTLSCYLILFISTTSVLFFISWSFYYLFNSWPPVHLLCLISYCWLNCFFFLYSLTNLNPINCIRSLLGSESRQYLFSIYSYFLSQVGLFSSFFSSLRIYHAYCFVNTLHMRLFSIVYDGLMLIIIVFFIVMLVIVIFVIFTFFFLQLQLSFVFFFLHFEGIPLTLQEELYSTFPWFKERFL